MVDCIFEGEEQFNGGKTVCLFEGKEPVNGG